MKKYAQAKKYVLAFDIGGTKMRAALVDRKYRIISKIEVDTPKSASKVLAFCLSAREQLLVGNELTGSDLLGAGISRTGVIDQNGVTLRSSRPYSKGLTLAALSKALGLRSIRIDNDMKCAALGELVAGAGRKLDTFVAVTISTGIGSGVVIDRKVYRGADHYAGEIGHMPGFDQYRDSFWEGYASGNGIARMYKKRTGKTLSAAAIQAQAEQGEKIATEVFNENARYIASGLRMVLKVIDPGVIIASGSHWINAWNLLTPVILDEIKKDTYMPPVKIIKTPLKGNAPLIGAAALVFHK